jgi:hypothetical protein
VELIGVEELSARADWGIVEAGEELGTGVSGGGGVWMSGCGEEAAGQVGHWRWCRCIQDVTGVYRGDIRLMMLRLFGEACAGGLYGIRDG